MLYQVQVKKKSFTYFCLLCREFALPWVDLDLKDGKDHHKGSRNKSKSGGHRSSISSLGKNYEVRAGNGQKVMGN